MKRAAYVAPWLMLTGCSLVALPLRAQQAAARPTQAVYTYVSQPPHLPGSTGEADIARALQQAVVYPVRAKEQGVKGKVFVRLTVDPEGTITNIDIARSLRPDCDSAVLAAVGRLPKLVPAQQNGRPVYYAFSLPISFPPASSSKP